MLNPAGSAFKTNETVDRTEMSRSLSPGGYPSLRSGHCLPQKMPIRPAISGVSTGLSRRDRIT
jgi:hypothetical protein